MGLGLGLGFGLGLGLGLGLVLGLVLASGKLDDGEGDVALRKGVGLLARDGGACEGVGLRLGVPLPPQLARAAEVCREEGGAVWRALHVEEGAQLAQVAVVGLVLLRRRGADVQRRGVALSRVQGVVASAQRRLPLRGHHRYRRDHRRELDALEGTLVKQRCHGSLVRMLWHRVQLAQLAARPAEQRTRKHL